MTVDAPSRNFFRGNQSSCWKGHRQHHYLCECFKTEKMLLCKKWDANKDVAVGEVNLGPCRVCRPVVWCVTTRLSFSWDQNVGSDFFCFNSIWSLCFLVVTVLKLTPTLCWLCHLVHDSPSVNYSSLTNTVTEHLQVNHSHLCRLSVRATTSLLILFRFYTFPVITESPACPR